MAETSTMSPSPTSGGRWWRISIRLALLFLLVSIIYACILLIDALSNGVVV